MGKHSATTSARLFDSAVVPLFCQQDMHRNSVQKYMSGLWMARRFLDGMRTGSPRSRTLAIQLQLRLSQRARTTEDRGENGLDGGTCAPTMGDSAGTFLQHTLFFHTIGHLMRFGSERRLLLTVKNLLMAPGGPRWGCDVGCTCNRGGIGRRAWSAAPGTPSRQNLLSPSVAGRGAPGYASCALQPLDDKALRVRPAGWHGLCSLREWRPDGEPGGGRRGERSPMRHAAPGTTVDRRAPVHSA